MLETTREDLYESSFCVKEKGSSEKNKKFQNHLELSYYGSDWNGLAVFL